MIGGYERELDAVGCYKWYSYKVGIYIGAR